MRLTPPFPNPWSISPAKYLYQRANRGVRDEDEIVTAFRDGEVTLRTNRRTEGFTNAIAETGYQGIREGDLVVHSMDGFAGAIGVSDSDGKSSPVVHAYRPTGSVDPRFHTYLLRTYAEHAFITSLAKGIRQRSTSFDPATFGALELPTPSLAKQRLIADFLDRETHRIDALVDAKRRMIDRLDERLIAFIETAAHTPADGSKWKITSLKRLCRSIQTGPFGSQVHNSDYIYGGTPLVNPTDIRNTTIVLNPDVSVDETKKSELARHTLELGDIVLARRGEMGRCAVVGQRVAGSLCGTGSLRIRVKSKVAAPDYYQAVISSRRAVDFFRLNSVGSTMDNLSAATVAELPVPVPPLANQQELVAQISRRKQTKDELTSSLTRQLDLLAEYRRALITQAVTGQLDEATLKGHKPVDEAVGVIPE